jgi:hypothetical protein
MARKGTLVGGERKKELDLFIRDCLHYIDWPAGL